MSSDLLTIERHLSSKDKEVRLKALKLLLRHPDASPIQLVRGLCSDDDRNFEFLRVFELDAAVRESWSRLRGVQDDDVYEYLASLYATNAARNMNHVVHLLELLCTPRALKMLEEMRDSLPSASRSPVERAVSHVSHQLVAKEG